VQDINKSALNSVKSNF